MARFETTTMVRRPVPETRRALRDGLPELAPLLEDVRAIETVERQTLADGAQRVVSVWHADAAIPASLARFVDGAQLAWTDRAEWNASGDECRFVIEPHFLPGSLRCEGRTRLEPAMGGRGTRVRFEGDFTVQRLPSVARALGSTFNETVERFAADMIARNLSRLGRALSAQTRQESP